MCVYISNIAKKETYCYSSVSSYNFLPISIQIQFIINLMVAAHIMIEY